MNIFFARLKTKYRNIVKPKNVNPHLHWSILVEFFLVITVLLIAFGFYLLYKVKNEQIFQVDQSTVSKSPVLVKDKLLNQVNDSFKNKELRSNDILSGKISFPDPSK